MKAFCFYLTKTPKTNDNILKVYMDSGSKLTQDIAKAHSLNMWGSTVIPKPKLTKNDFLKSLQESKYTEITDADLSGRSMSFSFQINGETYQGHSLLSEEFIDTDRLFRKMQVADFNTASISKKNTLPLTFSINNVENKSISTLIKSVIRIIDSDDGKRDEVIKPPQKPPSSSGRARERSRELVLFMGA